MGVDAPKGRGCAGDSPVGHAPVGTPRPTSTPKPPTATVDPQIAEAASYAAAVLPQIATLQNDFNQVGTDSSNQDFVACRTDLQKVITDSTSFQNVLNQNPPPACIKSADKEIRQGLVDYKDGTYIAIQGINNLDASEINAGSRKFSKGTTAFNTVTTDLGTAKC